MMSARRRLPSRLVVAAVAMLPLVAIWAAWYVIQRDDDCLLEKSVVYDLRRMEMGHQACMDRRGTYCGSGSEYRWPEEIPEHGRAWGRPPGSVWLELLPGGVRYTSFQLTSVAGVVDGTPWFRLEARQRRGDEIVRIWLDSSSPEHVYAENAACDVRELSSVLREFSGN